MLEEEDEEDDDDDVDKDECDGDEGNDETCKGGVDGDDVACDGDEGNDETCKGSVDGDNVACIFGSAVVGTPTIAVRRRAGASGSDVKFFICAVTDIYLECTHNTCTPTHKREATQIAEPTCTSMRPSTN